MTFSLRGFVSATAAAVLLSGFLFPARSLAAVGDLYAVTGSGGGGGFCGGAPLSSLYTFDPTDASATLIGAITVGGDQVRHVTGIAFHPVTGVLYAVMNSQVADVDCDFASLLTIDPAAGVATVIGDRTLAGPIPDIAFDPFGTLYGWTEYDDDLLIIDITDGSYTTVFSDIGTSATGLESDSAGRMYLKTRYDVMRLNPYTGNGFDNASVDGETHNLLAIDTSDVLFTGYRDSDSFTLSTLDPVSGELDFVGLNSVPNVSGLAFNRGVVTPPDVSDLELNKEVDLAEVLVGDNVVFTLELTNNGPDAANNVVVKDPLPAAFEFVSATGDGSYDEISGEWTLSSVADATTVSIEITAQAYTVGDYTNTAEVVSTDSYDSDSVPGSGEGDTFDSVEGSVTVPTLFSIDRRDPYLWIVDPTFNTSEAAQEITVSGRTVCGGNGLAAQPGSGTLFGVLQVDDCGSNGTRILASIDPMTAEGTEIGAFGSVRIAAMAFGADATTLYATSGNNGASPRRLFTVDTTDGTLTQKCVLESSNYGRALAFANDRIYDATYACDSICQLVFREIDPANFPVDPADTCPGTTIETGLSTEPTGMAVRESSPGSVAFFLGSFYSLYQVNVPGASDPADYSFLGSMSADTKGLALTVADFVKGNLQITKSAGKDRVKGDKFLNYLIYVSNSGPDTIENVVVTDPVPSGTTFVSADSSCNESAGVVTCDVPTLNSGDSQFLSFRVQVTCKKCSSISNTAAVSTSSDVYEYPYDNTWGISTAVKGKF